MSISQLFPEEGPTLNLNFAGSRTLDPRITFSRSSVGTYMDANGLIVTAAADEPRFDHRYVNGEIESLGLLIEEQRTNLVTNNEDLSQWGLNANPIVTSNDTVSPDGNITADKVTQTNQIYSGVTKQMSGITTNTVYSCSVFIKPDGDTRTRFGFFDTSNWQGFLDTNWTNGEPSTFSTNSSDVVYEEYPNGWYRASFKASTQSNAFVGTVSFHCHPDRTGTGKSAWFWGAQLEAGAFPTSYIPTEGSTKTRNPDNSSMTGTNFSDWFNSSEGTIVVDSLVEYNPEATKFVYGISGGSYDLNLRQPHLTGGKFRAVIGGTFSSAPGTGGNAVNGSTTKAAVAYTSSTGRLQVGDSGVDVTPGGAVDGNQLSIGAHNGRIKQLTYYPTRLSNTVLQTLTK